MDTDPLHYETWIEEALRGVMRRTLTYAADIGLPGDHHFYVTYRIDADGVELPGYLRAEHPDEMTIVLQHEFEDLVVEEEAFMVTLRFNGKPERLRVPFAAVVTFADPSVDFGLQLNMPEGFDGGVEIGSRAGNFEPRTIKSPAQQDTARPAGGKSKGEVIALDAFRKK